MFDHEYTNCFSALRLKGIYSFFSERVCLELYGGCGMDTNIPALTLGGAYHGGTEGTEGS